MTLSLNEIRHEAERLLADVEAGGSLDERARALIDLGVKASVTSLDGDALDAAIERALAVEAEPRQVQEIIALVSGLGVHSLMVSMTRLLSRAAGAGAGPADPLDADARRLWAHHIGDDPYWNDFEKEFPGFLDALLRMSPRLFQRFHEYCAVPWETRAVPAVTKELAAMACDATPAHRFLPGFRLHLRNAVKLGAGRSAVLEALEIAAAAPLHPGWTGQTNATWSTAATIPE